MCITPVENSTCLRALCRGFHGHFVGDGHGHFVGQAYSSDTYRYPVVGRVLLSLLNLRGLLFVRLQTWRRGRDYFRGELGEV